MADSDEQTLAEIPDDRKARMGDKLNTGLIGGPETIRRRINAFEEAGVQDLVLRFIDGTNREALRRFADEFIA